MKGASRYNSEHRRIIPVYDDDTDMELDAGSVQPEAAATRSGNPSNNNGIGQETQIDPFKNVTRGPPHTDTASLPLHRRAIIESTASEKYLEYDLDFRLNSIYDCIRDSTTVDLNTDAGALYVFKPTAESGQTQPMWRTYYSDIYQYYTVIGARWRLMIENMSTRPIYVHTIYRGSMYPPQGVDRKYMRYWPDSKEYRLEALAKIVQADGYTDRDWVAGAPPTISGATENAVGVKASNVLTIGDQWKPGQVTREIRDDTEAKIWTAMTASPSLEENLVIRISPEDNNDQRTGVQSARGVGDVHAHFRFRYELDIEYLVQFKDTYIQVRYQTSDNPVSRTKVSYTTL